LYSLPVLVFFLAIWGVAPPASAADNVAGHAPERFVREGISVEFFHEPAEKKVAGGKILEGEYAEIRFRVTNEGTGKPIRALRPGAWMDIRKPLGQKEKTPLDCRQKVSLYLQGIVGIQPMVNLNGYFVLVMNREPNIFVIDPFVGITGRTNLYASIPLGEPGTDWAKDRDEKRFYVTLSKSGKVAVIDAEKFRLAAEVDAGANPVRVSLQPDGRLLWVGNDGKDGGEGGVTAIDTVTLKAVASIPTGKGHHELAFSPDSRFAYVTNRGSGTVSVIDVRERKKILDVPTGPQPISMDYSEVAGALYVADGQDGTVTAIDGRSHEVAARVQVKPGLGPLRFASDGRWGLILNSRENAVHILDASTNTIPHTVPVGKEPFQMALSRSFAHVRCLGSEKVYMVNLLELGKETPPPVNSYPVGAESPDGVPDVGLARGISNAVGESEVLAVNPVNRTTYFYMEGMNAPSGTFRNYGMHPRAVETANRSLRETEPGVYTTRARFPVAGEYDVAFFLDSPRIVHCFSSAAEENPGLKKAGIGLSLEYLVEARDVPASDNVFVRFRLADPVTGLGKEGIQDVTLISFRTPGRDRRQTVARDAGEGVYEANLNLSTPGAYFVYVTVPSMKIGFRDFVHLSLRVTSASPSPSGADAGSGGKVPGEGK
jgi:YVTN family beta-propeller protein